ncbi:flagellar basal body L-ring protein FlgH [Parvularcula sp. ZS-1/3]|uniref:Flagellar L-ring protein n=1 Tax=Parvularcula mediterranea TaxID=2732508 RepID=A0A7Y3RPN8_9PROT|nr:flagellar basal body L-ring protein FlgH [Parvularcula mediterranea]NNU17426.1 flagellar basal body L-ring protein FlgH [Parvularcula mediterranea]
MRKNPITLSLLGALVLSACASVNNPLTGPHLSDVANPAQQQEARVVRMPMPIDHTPMSSPNSLWEANKRSFFRDQRANNVGDILTVLIDIRDEARLRNTTSRGRDTANELQVGQLFGIVDYLQDNLPDRWEPNANLEGSTDTRGTGEINRNEEISLRIAAVVTDRLPNGNFVIAGRQEVQVNKELRELRIAGVIRPEDITADNAIPYFKIAEARIAYGGRGTISTVQQPPYGQRLYEFVVPF